MKKNKSLNLLGKSAVFTGMTILQKGIAFFLVPLYTHILSPNEYGIANLVNSVAAIYILISSFALDDAMARYYFEFRGDKNKLKITVATITFASLTINIITFSILLIGNKVLIMPFVNDIKFYPYVLLSLIPVLCSSVYGLMQKILIIEGNAWHYSLNSLIFFITNTSLCILFIVHIKIGVLGLLLASAITYGIYFIYSLLYLTTKMSFSLDKQIFVTSMKYGMILLPNRVASWGMGGINKVLIGNKMSIYSLGIYNVATTFSSLMIIFSNSLSLSLQPWIYNKLEKMNEGQNDINRVINILAALFCIVGFTISLFCKEIFILLINSRYHDAINIMPTLLLGTTASAYSVLFVNVLFYYTDYTKYIAYSTIIGAIINIAICLIFVPLYGALGACMAISLSEITTCLYKMYYAIKAVNQKFMWSKMYYFLFINFIISQISIIIDIDFMTKLITYVISNIIYILSIKNDLIYFKNIYFINNKK
jgi:O-antigen/teichoic acid export membrane protein